MFEHYFLMTGGVVRSMHWRLPRPVYVYTEN